MLLSRKNKMLNQKSVTRKKIEILFKVLWIVNKQLLMNVI